MTQRPATAEHARLAEATGRAEDDLFTANPWYEWGPYLSERAWGTVREDYSASGDAWSFFPHDHARSRAYRWNEDGMAGISDVRHELCLALALWNGRDPILKERMFGLTGPQGNHGEDVKEYWWYLEGLPSHALLRWRYHYPQAAFPYEQLVDHGRGLQDPELELLDTGVFDDDRYWSVEVTYAKASPDGDPPAHRAHEPRPRRGDAPRPADAVVPQHLAVGRDGDASADRAGRRRRWSSRSMRSPATGWRPRPAPDGSRPEALFCENETNTARVFGTDPSDAVPEGRDQRPRGLGPAHGQPGRRRHQGGVPLRGDRRRAEHGRAAAPAPSAGGQAGPKKARKRWAGEAFDEVVAAREADADEFYAALAPADTSAEAMQVLRQACAGLVWSKQMYPYDVRRWLDGDPGQPAPPEARRNGAGTGTGATSTRSTCSRCPTRGSTRGSPPGTSASTRCPGRTSTRRSRSTSCSCCSASGSMHPNGALPAYEWNFDDVNPPVHVMAALRVFRIDGSRDREFLERVFQKLLVNFTWWVNRQDADGNNVFGGGFLGLDNISPIDRSNLPDGVTLEQADGTAWMAYYTLSMLLIAIVLAQENDVYEDMVVKFLEQFVLIARALERQGLYDAEDAFFYDRITQPGGRADPGQGEDDRRPDPAAARRRPAHADGRAGAAGSASGSRACASASSRPAAASSAASASSASGGTRARLGALARRPAADARASSSTRTRSSRPTACAPSRSATRTRRTRSRASPARRSTTSRRSRRRRCSAATRTGAARSGCR